MLGVTSSCADSLKLTCMHTVSWKTFEGENLLGLVENKILQRKLSWIGRWLHAPHRQLCVGVVTDDLTR